MGGATVGPEDVRHTVRQSTDPRVERTRKLIFEAAQELSARGDEVSVSSLVRTAGVSRSVFYLHFADLSELALQMIEPLFDEITAAAAETLDVDPARAMWEAHERLTTRIGADRALYRAALALPANTLLDQMRDAMLIPVLAHVEAVAPPGDLRAEMAARYVAAAAMNLLADWITEKFDASAEEVATHLHELMPTWMRERADRSSTKTTKEKGNTMKASVVREFGKGFELADIDIATPIGREVLIDVRAAGLCHSDELAATQPLGYEPPMVLGHEVAGVVSAVGPDVTEVSVGDHVVGSLVQYCGVCRRCIEGKHTLCLNPALTERGAGEAPRLSENGKPVAQGMALGGFAQQILVHENQVAVVPEEIPWAQAALLGCGVVTGAGAVLNAANVDPSDAVVVIGAGGVGLNALNGAVTAGAATIIAIDIADEKLERARSFGATHVINSTKEDPVEAVRKITGVGADAVFDFVGINPVLQQAVEMVAPGGALYLIGALDPSATLSISPVETLGAKRRIEGVFMGSTTPKRDIPLYARLYLEGRFELDALVSKEISLGEINEGYEALKDPNIARVVVTDLS